MQHHIIVATASMYRAERQIGAEAVHGRLLDGIAITLLKRTRRLFPLPQEKLWQDIIGITRQFLGGYHAILRILVGLAAQSLQQNISEETIAKLCAFRRQLVAPGRREDLDTSAAQSVLEKTRHETGDGIELINSATGITGVNHDEDSLRTGRFQGTANFRRPHPGLRVVQRAVRRDEVPVSIITKAMTGEEQHDCVFRLG